MLTHHRTISYQPTSQELATYHQIKYTYDLSSEFPAAHLRTVHDDEWRSYAVQLVPYHLQ